MNERNDKRRPGSLLLDRWLLAATLEERERAHDQLRRFARALLRIAIREVREEQAGDSPDLATQDTMSVPPPV